MDNRFSINLPELLLSPLGPRWTLSGVEKDLFEAGRRRWRTQSTNEFPVWLSFSNLRPSRDAGACRGVSRRIFFARALYAGPQLAAAPAFFAPMIGGGKNNFITGKVMLIISDRVHNLAVFI